MVAYGVRLSKTAGGIWRERSAASARSARYTRGNLEERIPSPGAAMNSPWPRQTELAALRQAVSETAAQVLEQAHPEFATRFRAAVQNGADINRALDAAGKLPPDSPFAPWRRILTAFVEL